MGGRTAPKNSAWLLIAVFCFLALPLPSCLAAFTDPEYETHVYVDEDAKKGFAITNVTDRNAQGPERIRRIEYDGSDHAFYAVEVQGQQKWMIVLNRTLDSDRGEKRINLQFTAKGASTTSDTTFLISLDVKNVNDIHPEFEDLPYNAEVKENTPSDTVIYSTVHAVDMDDGLNGTVRYFLQPVIQGSAGAGWANKFRMDPISGNVTLKGSLDYESKTFYHFSVVAKDLGTPSLNSTADLFITVKDVQDSPPIFTNLPYIKSINENASLTTSVLKVRAVDQDRAIPNDVTYNITQSTCAGSFQMDSTSGVISVAGSLDRDNSTIKRNNGVCTITVQATEQPGQYPQTGKFTAVTTATINVNDVNDNAPRFTSGTTFSASISENSPSGTPLQLDNNQDITVVDIDQGLNSQVHLALASGGDTFELVTQVIPSSGSVQLRVKDSSRLDFEARESLTVKITATDNGHQPVTATVSVQLLNVNEHSPVFVQTEYNGTALEGSSPGTPVVTVNATDADAEAFGTVKYSLRNGRGIFRIDADSGAVTVASNETDREKVDFYYMLVIATDGGQLKDAVPLTVTITDANDENPAFQRDRYDAILDEDNVFFSRPVTVKATDADEPNTDNSRVTYSILSAEPSGLSGHFYVNPVTGLITVTSALDFDTIAFPPAAEGIVRLIVQASDNGSPTRRSATAIVAVTLNDVNDNPPIFQNTPYARNIQEGSASGTSVLQVEATDNDGSIPNNVTTYSIESGGQGRFHIDPDSGLITVSSTLDREQTVNYTLVVVARDRAAIPKSASSEVAIIITDVNDEPPTFGAKADARFDRPELFDGVLYRMSATDPDTDSELHYSILYDKSSGQSGNFASLTPQQIRSWVDINSTSGQIYTKKPLDRQQVRTLTLQVQVIDTKGVERLPQLDRGNVTIIVLDVDNNPPVFSETSVTISVDENAAAGIPFNMSQIVVTDSDEGENSRFTLSVSGINDQTVVVVPESAIGTTVVVLRVGPNNTVLDYETNKALHFQLVAEGQLNTSMRSVCQVTLNINNVNDHAPQFSPGQSYSASIKENSSNGTLVTNVTATDGDSGVLGEITYSILGDNNLFTVDPESGTIRTALNSSDYDREKTAKYFLTVIAKDQGGRTATAAVQVTLTDVNDNPPVFLQQEYSAFLQEMSHVLDREVIVEAEDKDEKDTPDSQISYGIVQTPGSPSMNFSVNETSGQIHIVSPLDFESLPKGGVVSLNISATDHGLPAKTGYVTVSVTVKDKNDNEPVFTNTSYSGHISENANPGVPVAQVLANDNDGSPPNNEVFYIIASGGSDRFQVNSTSGEVTTVVKLDREVNSNYTLTVLAMDRGSPALTDTATVSIFVDNVNDYIPRFMPSDLTVPFLETQSSGIPVASLPAVDEDEDADLFYWIAWNMSSGLNATQQHVTQQILQSTFEINSSLGTVLTSSNGLDREKLDSARLVIVVKDKNAVAGTQQTTTGTLSIQVQDADDNPPEIFGKPFKANVSENAPRGTPLLLDPEMTVKDPDKDENGTFYLTLSNYTNCLEVIPSRARSETTVLIRVTDPDCFDYESVTAMDFEVIATGEHNRNLIDTAPVHLSLININDETPYFNSSSYDVVIDENLNISAYVTEVQAVDLDKPPYDNFTYSIQGGDGVFSIDERSGVVLVAKKKLDYEVRKEYQLLVEATDIEGRRGSATLNIALKDVNDETPKFVQPEYRAFVKENAADFPGVVQVEAEDKDEKDTPNSQISYGIVQTPGSPSMNFSVNETSGQIHIISPLDFESLPKGGAVSLNISATDHGSPAKTGYVTVSVTVEDENDNEPVFTHTTCSGNITENEKPDYVVAKVHAEDNDSSSPNKDVFYIIASGGNDRFRMNSTSGEITTVIPLDREKKSNYTLTVLAMDRGSPSLTATTTVSIYVENVNDDPPQFSPAQISVSVTETPKNGSTITLLPVTDLDEDASLQYHILWNASKGFNTTQKLVTTDVLKQNFMMMPSQNILMTSANGLDREAVESASLVIVVVDKNAASGTQQTTTGTVSIQVQDADDNPPKMSGDMFNATLTENSPKGTPLELDHDIIVTDLDKDENSTFQLTLSNYSQCLEVVPASGRSEATVLIRVTNVSCFDYEDRSSMEFDVIATGEQNASQTSRAPVHLRILNINDESPHFNQLSYSASVYENLSIAASVIRVQAVDLDKPPFNAFNYSIQSGDGMFSINENGEVTLAKDALDYEKRKSYQVMLEATDEGKRRDLVQLSITVLDVNDEAPTFDRLEYQAFVKEKEFNFDRGVTVKADDRDGPGNNSKVYYSLSDSSEWSANFSINATSGRLQLKSPLDYEALGPDSDGIITLVILATDCGTPRLTGNVTVNVTVQDVNDCAPVFNQSSYYGNVTENKEAGIQVTAVSATDCDGSAPNNDVFYQLASGGNDQFRINSTTGDITTTQRLDREFSSTYSLKVLAVDRGSPSQTSSIIVSIDVININDEKPKFQKRDATVTRMEGLNPGSLVFNYTALDRDENADLEYTLLWSKSSGFTSDQVEVGQAVLQDAFKIDRTTGSITVNKLLDRETLDTATLVVFVEDRNADTASQNDTGTLSIQVQDADDNPPLFSASYFNASIFENAPDGTPVQFGLLMSLDDIDKDVNSRFNLSLTNYSECLSIIPSAARAQANVVIQVSDHSCFDYEKQEFMDFEVLATPYVNISNEQRASVRLNIINVNDETPKFVESLYAVNVSEDAIGGTSVITVQANDEDKPSWNIITYSLQGGDGRFVIDNTTGKVTVGWNITLDFETRKEYQLTVEATDTGRLRDSVELTVKLLDVNDHSPEFLRPEYQAFIKENDANPSLVTVKATDKDDGINQEIEYSISPTSDLADNFTMNATCGRLGTSGSSGLDYESLPNTTTGVVNLTLLACDRGVPSLCSNVSLLITVADENDHTPEFSQVYHQNISEDAEVGASLVQVSATDKDGRSPNNNVFYVMASGGNDKFRVDSSTGWITRSGQLDSDTQNFYNLTINAIDGGSQARTATTYVTVNIIDVNDVSPKFEPPSRIISVNETNEIRRINDAGRRLLPLWAKDTDVDSSLLYTMVWKDSQAFGPNQEPLQTSVLEESFQIQHTDNEIQVHSTLDRERLSRAILVINVTDQNAANSSMQTSTGTLTVNVLDVNDHEPTFNMIHHYTAEIQENSVKDSVLKMVLPERMTVTDQDTDQNCVFNVSVIGLWSTYFTAEPSTARSFALVQIRVRNGSVLDYEDRQFINFTVKAVETDTNDQFNNTAVVTLNIIDVNDNYPEFENDTYHAFVPERSAAGLSFLHIQAHDKDSGEFGNVTYSLEGDAERFVIDEITGELTTADNTLDREVKDTYLMTVVAKDGGGLPSSAYLRITITDINDEAPSFQTNYSTSVLENTLTLSPPVTLQASDKDEEGSANSNFTYHLTSCAPVHCSNFSLDLITGALTIISELNYEKTDRVTLNVEARDQGSPNTLTGTAVVRINVKDANDVDPAFTSNKYSANVTENAVEGTNVTMVEALDGDGEKPNNVVFYVLDSGRGSDKFRVDGTTGLITVGPGAKLDREVEDGTLSLTVLAIDRGNPPRSSSVTVTVSLLDENDEQPVFAEVRKEVEVYENASIDYELEIMGATDADADADLLYTWLLNESLATTDRDAFVNIFKVQDWFLVDQSTGQVTVKSKLDREMAEVITLKILVNDTNGLVNIPQIARATLVIKLLDVNDNAPIISGSSVLNVSESLDANTEVASFSAQDKDRDQDVTFSILNETDGSLFFKISPAGKIFLSQKIDREKTPVVSFVVIATDDGTPSQSSNLTVNVTVLDANDNTPRFDNTSYVFYVSEDADKNTTVAVVNATDDDIGRNAEVTFAFAENILDFAINRTSGEIFVKGALNRETQPTFNFGVVALDNPATYDTRSVIQQISIQITDINDNAPVFTNLNPGRDSYWVQIDETSPDGTQLSSILPGAITASDKDHGQNSNLSFYLTFRGNSSGLTGESSDQYLFRIDEVTGEMFVNGSIEGKADIYNYTITVADHGQPSALSATANLTVVVKDQNINKPYFVGNYSSVSVPECAGIGTTITRLHARDDDRDKETNGKVQYFLDDLTANKADHAFFHLDKDSGDLISTKLFNRENQSVFHVYVKVQDMGLPQPFSNQLPGGVTISVDDGNDEPAVFKASDYYFNITEEQAPSPVGTVFADDPDAIKQTCYQLNGNLSSFFFITTQTDKPAELKLVSPLDREDESQASFILDITATDCTPSRGDGCQQSQFPASLAKIHINVRDINDNPPKFTKPRLTVGVTSTANTGHVIVDLQGFVTDRDIGKNRVHSFHPVGDYVMDKDLMSSFTPSDRPLTLSTNGSIATFADLPRDAQGFFTWKIMVNDSAGNDTVVLKIYVVGEDKLIRITFSKSMEELRRTQNEILSDLKDKTGLEFVADDRVAFEDGKGVVDPYRSVLIAHAIKNNEVMLANALRDFLDHAIKVTTYLRAQHKLYSIETFKAAAAQNEVEPRTDYILGAIICVLVVAFLITLFLMINNIRRFKRKLKAATIETYPMSHQAKEAFPGIKTPQTNPIFGKDEIMEKDEYGDKRSNHLDNDDNDSLDHNSVDIYAIPYKAGYDEEGDDEQEVTLDLYGEDTDNHRVPHHSMDTNYHLNEALAEHERRKYSPHTQSNGVGGYHHQAPGVPVQNGKRQTVMLQQDDNYDLDDLESTEI